MYTNLMAELRRKGISNRVVAALIGCNERTVVNKLNGTSDFLLSEGILIHRNLLPEFDADYLYARSNDGETA